MADEVNSAENPLDASKTVAETTETNDANNCFQEEIVETKENNVPKIEDNTNKTKPETSELSPPVQKTRKTYENRKNNTETTSSPEATTSSPNQNTSRYGRARKPKITEDFYNIEDIFGPYERIPSSSSRIKSKKIELSPNKSKESINLPENDLNSVLSIEIPDDSTSEVSKVMKIVSNNSEFSPKSPSYTSKPVKTYANKNKKDSDVDKYEFPFLNCLDDEENSDCSEYTVNESENLCKSEPLIFNSVNKSVERTKNRLSLKKNTGEDKQVEGELSTKNNLEDKSSENDENLVKTTKRLNKLQKELNIGELKSGRLRSSIAEEAEVEKEEIPDDIIEETLIKKEKNDLNLKIGELKAGRQRSSITEEHKMKEEEIPDENDDIIEAIPIKKEKKIPEVITIDDTEDPKTYLPKVGDLAWSRVGSYPFWPSIVTNEPGTERCFKELTIGRRFVKSYHVHFFGDNGRRSWVYATHIFPFNKRSDLEVMAQSVSKDSKPKDPKHLSAFIINPNKLQKWETAVTEAENITDFPRENRIKKFFVMVNPLKKTKQHILSPPKTNILNKKNSFDKKKIKKLSKNISSKSFLKEKKLLKAKTDVKIKVEDDISLKSPTPIIKEEPNDEKTPKNKVRNYKNRLSNLEVDKNKKTPKTFDDSNDSSDSETKEIIIKQERDTSSPQPQLSSLQRHKRINLFRGISKDRVCQICGKNKNVYKCKGSCFGLYHVECDKKIRIKVLSKIEERSNISSDSESSQDIIKSNNLDEKNDSNNEDKLKNVTLIVEEILQNVFKTVENSCSETNDVKLSTKEEVKKEDDKKINRSLSIAEQIDIKMQEVMKDLIGATNYENSEEEEDVLPVDQPSQSQRSSTEVRQSDASKPEEEEEKSNKIKKIIKHVTADGIFDVIEEEEINNEDFKCAYCLTGVTPPCFICNEDLSKSGEENRHKCGTAQCGKYFHSECLKDWPQTKWNVSSKSKKIENETLLCPYHSCHTCISDNPRAPLSRYLYEKLAKCIRCPTTYHISNYCIPAGTEILSNYQLICPKHLLLEEDPSSSPGTKKPSKNIAPKKIMPHVNASWCFICSTGGSLICCETCPSSFHVECLKLVPPEGRYLCEECESGRLPLYDEIVWVKLGAYRWWPAQILFPADVPPNVACISHVRGEFVVRFFGSHDHYWVNRGRVFLFQEGDTGHASSKKSAVDGLFVKAIQEATKAHKKFVEERANRAAEAQNGMKPPPYSKIKVNRNVGNVRSTDADTSNTTPCDCDPSWEEPCGPDSDCLNRILLTECNPMVCAAGSRCCNQSFEKRLYAAVAPFKTAGRGWGLKTLAPVKKGSFVIEYVGEVIDEQEYRRRMKRKHEQKDENYYFLTIDKDRMIDAGPKGNVARFMNHSCSPNCETQKWTINGDTRVGLFAITDIPSDAELTFNYNLECIGEEKKECRCGAPNCSGFIGAKAKQDELSKKRKSVPLKSKKKKSLAPEIKAEINICFVCGEPEAVQACDREACNKYYHLSCINLENYQEGKWLCPWHTCNFCTKRTTRSCFMCINSYCPLHSEGNIRYDRVKGFVCTHHDIKEEEDTEITLEETTKNKDSLKLKKNKKSIRNSIRSSTESSKNIEEITNNQNIQIEYINEIKEKALLNSTQIQSLVQEETNNSSLNEDKIKENDAKQKIPVKNGIIHDSSKKKTNKIEDTNMNTSNQMLQIDIFISSIQNNKNKNSTIKKRKSRLSLKQTRESSNSSQESSEDEKPLLTRKKIKLSSKLSCDSSDEDKPLITRNKIKSNAAKKENLNKKENKKKKVLKFEENSSQTEVDSSDLQSSDSDTKLTERKSSKKIQDTSSSFTDYDYSDSSESDFVSSPRKISSKVPKKKDTSLQNKTKKTKKNTAKTTMKNNSKEESPKMKNIKNKIQTSTPKIDVKSLSKEASGSASKKKKYVWKESSRKKTIKYNRKSMRNLKQYRGMKFSDEEIDSSSKEENDTIEDLNNTKEENTAKLNVKKKKLKKPQLENKTTDSISSLIEDLQNTIDESNTKDTSKELAIKKKKIMNDIEEDLEMIIKESKIIKKTPNIKKKKLSLNSDTIKINNTSISSIEDIETIIHQNKITKNIAKKKKIISSNNSSMEDIESMIEASKISKRNPTGSLEKKIKKNPPNTKKKKIITQNEETIVTRKRGRPKLETEAPEAKKDTPNLQNEEKTIEDTSNVKKKRVPNLQNEENTPENTGTIRKKRNANLQNEEKVPENTSSVKKMHAPNLEKEKKMHAPNLQNEQNTPENTTTIRKKRNANLQNEEKVPENSSVKKMHVPNLEKEEKASEKTPNIRKTRTTNLQNEEKVPENTSSVKKMHVPNLEKEEKASEDTPTVKRKRGRPRKYPRPSETTTIAPDVKPPNQDGVTSPEIEPESPETSLPVAKRLKSLTKQHSDETKSNFEQVTELYKLNVSKTPFDNHVNEVKLTSNVPERHLRVVLRKNSEIDSKIDNKFLKMQNDLERDLPIRKRSKLRYEAQL